MASHRVHNDRGQNLECLCWSYLLTWHERLAATVMMHVGNVLTKPSWKPRKPGKQAGPIIRWTSARIRAKPLHPFTCS